MAEERSRPTKEQRAIRASDPNPRNAEERGYRKYSLARFKTFPCLDAHSSHRLLRSFLTATSLYLVRIEVGTRVFLRNHCSSPCRVSCSYVSWTSWHSFASKVRRSPCFGTCFIPTGTRVSSTSSKPDLRPEPQSLSSHSTAAGSPIRLYEEHSL
jgi:hypothetical protein